MPASRHRRRRLQIPLNRKKFKVAFKAFGKLLRTQRELWSRCEKLVLLASSHRFFFFSQSVPGAISHILTSLQRCASWVVPTWCYSHEFTSTLLSLVWNINMHQVWHKIYRTWAFWRNSFCDTTSWNPKPSVRYTSTAETSNSISVRRAFARRWRAIN